jgi:hypothetical protein
MQAPPGLPNCLDLKEPQRADCYVASTTDRHGYVVYENYRGCFNSWLAVPGFMLLPTWGLASEHMACWPVAKRPHLYLQVYLFCCPRSI